MTPHGRLGGVGVCFYFAALLQLLGVYGQSGTYQCPPGYSYCTLPRITCCDWNSDCQCDNECIGAPYGCFFEVPTSSPTGSASITVSSSASSTRSTTLSSTASLSATRTASRSRSRPSTPSVTPTATGMCPPPIRNITSLTGPNGTAPAASVGTYGNIGMYTVGYCRSGLSTFMAGPRLVYFLNLGPTTALGGSLRVTTCGHTRDNTVLYIGLGCPTWYGTAQCQAGNDDAGDGGAPACTSNPSASTITLPQVASRVFFVQVGAFPGADAVTGLAWTYTPPVTTQTRTRSRSPSRTPSHTRTRSRSASRSATPSRTRKPKRD
jgi:hypothetical protein